MRPFPLTLLAALFLSSCASVTYTPYEGRSNQYQGSDGTFVNRQYALPIYHGAPPRPFKVVGLINTSDRQMSIEGNDHAAVRAARANAADALILIDRKQLYGGSSGTLAAGQLPNAPWVVGTLNSNARWLEQTDYLAIKFR